jgi:hypothetical protein
MEESSRIANYFAMFFLRAFGSVRSTLLYKLNYPINSAQDKGARNLMITGKVQSRDASCIYTCKPLIVVGR